MAFRQNDVVSPCDEQTIGDSEHRDKTRVPAGVLALEPHTASYLEGEEKTHCGCARRVFKAHFLSSH